MGLFSSKDAKGGKVTRTVPVRDPRPKGAQKNVTRRGPYRTSKSDGKGK